MEEGFSRRYQLCPLLRFLTSPGRKEDTSNLYVESSEDDESDDSEDDSDLREESSGFRDNLEHYKNLAGAQAPKV
ncbi:unnamed protein product [Cochlearia groenlandica]